MIKMTPGEERVLRATAENPGRINKLLAFDLGIGEGTVKVYNSRLHRKLGVHGRREIVDWANANGFGPAQTFADLQQRIGKSALSVPESHKLVVMLLERCELPKVA